MKTPKNTFMPGKDERRGLVPFKDETMQERSEGDYRWEGRAARGWGSAARWAAAFPELRARAQRAGARPAGEPNPDTDRPRPRSRAGAHLGYT